MILGPSKLACRHDPSLSHCLVRRVTRIAWLLGSRTLYKGRLEKRVTSSHSGEITVAGTFHNWPSKPCELGSLREVGIYRSSTLVLRYGFHVHLILARTRVLPSSLGETVTMVTLGDTGLISITGDPVEWELFEDGISFLFTATWQSWAFPTTVTWLCAHCPFDPPITIPIDEM